MSHVARKSEVAAVDGTPEKRMFWSIISDYDLKTGLCELVDNAIDTWRLSKTRRPLKVQINLDADRQLISVIDNAGGVKHEELRLLVAPGGSRNDPDAELIGIFGVGSKRAGIALGEQVEIRTRFRRGKSFEVDITKDWLESPEWELPVYEIPDITPGTTQVDISHLRRPYSSDDIKEISDHLGETYNWFLNQRCVIEVNGTEVTAKSFDAWAYPPDFSPRSAVFEVDFAENGKINVEIVGGLIRDRIPERDNYGVYFYCNHRLIVKELKVREVGYFVTSEAGVPHPDASLCRVIVRLHGPAKLMPWNSSKSGINFGHLAFQHMRPTLIPLVRYFSSLSRRLKDDWAGRVVRHSTGTIEEIEPADISSGKRLVLPKLPRVRKSQLEKLKSRNRRQLENMPWTLGLVEAMGAVEIITRQKIETKNRIALILLDSNFEIALKEYIVSRADKFPPAQYGDLEIKRLFQNRSTVIAEVSQKVAIPQNLLNKARHYYGLRNKLIHERATVGITDSDVNNYRITVEKILAILFELKFPPP